MTKFILIRHGEPTYDEVISLGFKGHGIALAPLTENGINEVLKLCENKELEGSDILISSPYTRAMQTASIIGMKHNLMVNVEILLHEWLVDVHHNYNSTYEFTKNIKLAKKEWEEYLKNPNFVFSEDTESLLSVRNRALSVLENYCSYNKVIVVTHGLLISMLFNDKVRINTGDFTIVTSEELENNFNFKPKKFS